VDVTVLHRPENFELVAFEPDVSVHSAAGIMLRRVSIVTDSFSPAVGIQRDQSFDVGGTAECANTAASGNTSISRSRLET